MAGNTIGFTYGTFDLLHDGHRHLLGEARRRCSTLIVAIDSDRFARQRKGPGRPVEGEDVRSHNLVATGLVDLVVGVDSPRQLREAMEYYEPNFVFAGDNGQAQDIKGHDPSVILIPMLPGYSTTQRIREMLQ
jgi:D-beta-D-heptose 7-phosphate kinase/D-beta-D-heptose 1-phosphate adenosyltransferase